MTELQRSSVTKLELNRELSEWLGERDPFETFMAMEGELFRGVTGRRTLRFSIDDRNYFIKIHTGVGWREIIKNLFQLRLPVLGAEHEYQAIKRLTELDIKTTPLAGYGRRGWNPANQDSFLITKALDNTITLEEMTEQWASQPPPRQQLKRALIKQIATIARKLHQNGLNHRDFYVCHFNLNPDVSGKTPFPLYLMDLHRTQLRHRTPQRWIIKDIASIHFSSMDLGLTLHDRLRFMRFYRDQPLRTILQQEESFWNRVERRAEKLYRAHQIDLANFRQQQKEQHNARPD